MTAPRTYKGANIERVRSPGRLPWSAYVCGHFVSADTLAGIKWLISDELAKAGLKREDS